MKTNEIGTKPEGSKISFSADCFEVAGSRKVWTVSNPTGWGYPAKFYSETEARRVAQKKNHILTEGAEQILKRIKWN